MGELHGVDPTYVHEGPVVGVRHRAVGNSVYFLFADMAELIAWCDTNQCALGIIYPTDPNGDPDTWWNQ